ncbi:hypothetical protein AGDE_09574 [Angomonas deanei]|uniref:PDZ domain-containing protein n=1 Tax=Angomonas deanei TaxID=59799 RepID=A0A7G2CTD5_9TRYP|nr:hypothetical protein AGDE_09574 [Angomonas deanei]CAD2222775.1 hypothetical protein, conserved [Angomonas deanei]|eukprot:EPY30178.1 hypothetical protein AGDE_09574 [Angomonas deanei]
MSGFLNKLKGADKIDNSLPPDASGLVVRRLQKQYASEPPENLGLVLTDDAEIRSVAPNSAAAQANIQPNFMICYVNDEFVETKAEFLAAAANSIYMDVKLYSVEPMSELIAKLVDDEGKSINCDELLQTTPRYGFLSSEHPLFRRYTKRLDRQRHTYFLLKQGAKDMEEQLRLERQKEMQREAERLKKGEEERQEKEREEEKEKQKLPSAQVAGTPPPEAIAPTNEPFVKVDNVTSSFQVDKQVDEQVDKQDTLDEPDTLPEPELPNPVSTKELLDLVGVPTTTSAIEEPRYELLPSEEYTLSNGEKVVHQLKKRSGPLPPPPPGKPPKINKEARRKAA